MKLFRYAARQFRSKPNYWWLIPLGLYFSSVFLFLACGLFYRQIIQHDYFSQKEKRQNQRRIIIPAARGDIYDRNGKLLVHNLPTFELHLYFDDIRPEIRQEYTHLIQQARSDHKPVNRKQLQQQARINVFQKHCALANTITGRQETIDPQALERHYRESLLLPVTVLSNLSIEEYARLIDGLPPRSPLYIATSYYRFYPYHAAASHILGYVVSSMERVPHTAALRTFQFKGKTGKTGIELSQNSSLLGINGERIFSVDLSGFRADCIQEIPPCKGHDCTLSIDINLQCVAEQALEDKLGSIALIDVNSGEILAMASKPNYDANLLSPRISSEIYQKITQSGAWLNRALQGVYPPASTFKIISTIAFLRHKTSCWDDQDTSQCLGFTKIGPRIFNCDHSVAHGSVSLRKAMEKSCNVYYYLRSQICGAENIADEAKRFHLDKKTAVELPFETNRMIVPTPAWKEKKGYGKWYPGDTANMAIGQGYLLVSPLQMACFMASLAKNRTQTVPYILHDPRHDQSPYPTIGLRPKDYRALIGALQSVIDSGTGRLAKLDRVSSAGKSGTAQVWEQGEKRNVAWFVGFAPVENPSLAIAIAIQENSKHDNYYGGRTAAPIARQILNYYFNTR
ncbi:MAG: hypothetical protein LBB11_03610 [Puniceicoccales bacterium]|nr:hypothetical protein [Puniceicoccales bacterium]